MKYKSDNYSTLLDAFRYGRLGKYLSILLVLASLNTLGGCYYYKVVTIEDPPPEVIIAQQDEEKFFILHSGDQARKFSDIRVSDDTVVGEIAHLQGHEYYKTNPREYVNRYRVSQSPEKDEREVINEVHITISEFNAEEGNEISIPVEKIEKIEIYERDTGTTRASWAISGLGVFALLYVAIGVIYLVIYGVGD